MAETTVLVEDEEEEEEKYRESAEIELKSSQQIPLKIYNDYNTSKCSDQELKELDIPNDTKHIKIDFKHEQQRSVFPLSDNYYQNQCCHCLCCLCLYHCCCLADLWCECFSCGIERRIISQKVK